MPTLPCSAVQARYAEMASSYSKTGKFCLIPWLNLIWHWEKQQKQADLDIRRETFIYCPFILNDLQKMNRFLSYVGIQLALPCSSEHSQ
jgi:hypothetical protein